jgi:hypothetical protein
MPPARGLCERWCGDASHCRDVNLSRGFTPGYHIAGFQPFGSALRKFVLIRGFFRVSASLWFNPAASCAFDLGLASCAMPEAQDIDGVRVREDFVDDAIHAVDDFA